MSLSQLASIEKLFNKKCREIKTNPKENAEKDIKANFLLPPAQISETEDQQVNPEYQIPLFSTVKKPEPVYRPIYPDPIQPRVNNIPLRPGPNTSNIYPNYPPPNYSIKPPGMEQNYYNYPQAQRPIMNQYQMRQPNERRFYAGPNPGNPGFSNNLNMEPLMPNYPAWQPNYPPQYRNYPVRYQHNFPEDKANFYSGGVRFNANAQEYIPKSSMGMRPIIRNEFLDEFKQKLTYNRKISIEDIKGHIIELSRDQFGSRYLQQKAQNCLLEEKQIIFDEIKDQTLKLMFDVFGNYVVQIFLQYGTEEQKKALIDQLLGNIKILSLDMYGCRCVQKAIEFGTLDQKLALLEEIKLHIQEFVENQNANHVLQVCIGCYQQKHIEFILGYFKNNCQVMCKHPYGCRIMQRIIEKSKLINVS
jgi:hypothetical protein